jgi:peroxiredoxin
LGRIYDELQTLDTEVLVVGGGSPKDAERVVKMLKLPFPVLADPDRAVYLRYGLGKALLTIQRSGTFLIDKQGTIRHIEQGTLPQTNVDKAKLLREVEKLQQT